MFVAVRIDANNDSGNGHIITICHSCLLRFECVGFQSAGRADRTATGPVVSLLSGHCSPGRWARWATHLENESTDQKQGIAPVPLRVKPEPRRPGKIIAVPLSLNAYTEPRNIGIKLRGSCRPLSWSIAWPLTYILDLPERRSDLPRIIIQTDRKINFKSRTRLILRMYSRSN